MEKRWKILPFDEEKTATLQKELKISHSLCKILVQRGYDRFESAKSFFRPSLEMLHSPWLMKDMDKAVARIEKALSTKEKIFIFGDYDVDGTTSVASVYRFFCDIYDPALLDFYIPHRYREGYGVSQQGIDHAHATGHSLIICLDCGIKSVELIAYAKELGIDFIVCDHHLPGTELPDAVAILNAKQPGCPYPFKELCGCGVGFKLISAICEKLGLPDEKRNRYLDLVATAIAADIVPMVGENRILAYFGLQKINENPSPGIKALMHLSNAKVPLNITHVVFLIAPRVNAAGRMDDARKAVELFISTDEQKAMEFAEMLHTDNSDRKEMDRSITEHALSILSAIEDNDQKKSTVVYNEAWHKGVVGIVASRLIETHYRPTVVLTRSGDIATGSARSVVGFNLYEAIYACREYLIAYGGHFAAAGLSLLPENIHAFREKFEQVVADSIDEALLTPEIIIDAEIGFEEITDTFYNIICQMEPFGPENMHPIFVSRGVLDTGASRIVKEKHLRFVVTQNKKNFTGIGFNLAEKYPLLQNNQPVDLLYSIDLNEFNGQKNLQLKVIDVKPAQV